MSELIDLLDDELRVTHGGDGGPAPLPAPLPPPPSLPPNITPPPWPTPIFNDL